MIKILANKTGDIITKIISRINLMFKFIELIKKYYELNKYIFFFF